MKNSTYSLLKTPVLKTTVFEFGKSTTALQSKVGIPLLCTDEFIKYINSKIDKYPGKYRGFEETNASNVVENLIKVMNQKGFQNLNDEIVKQLHNDLSKNKFPRKRILAYIQESTGIDLGLVQEEQKPGTIRNIFTFPAKLDEATSQTLTHAKRAGLVDTSQVYGKTTQSLAKQGIQAKYDPLSLPELDFINKSPFYKNSDHFKSLGPIKSGRKTVCGNCWICGKAIYIYNLSTQYDITTDENWNLEVTCGQDEHVFPPGWGNLIGTLLPKFKETVASFDGITTTVFGLRPSHSWCNQLKRDRILVNPPGFNDSRITPENTGFSVNMGEIDRFVNDCRKKLKSINTHRYESYEQWFWPRQSDFEINVFVEGIRTNTTNTLENFCQFVNAPENTNTKELHNVYTMYLLQIIFNMCWFAGTVIFKDTQDFMEQWNDNQYIVGKKRKGGKKKTKKIQKRRNKTIRVKGGALTDSQKEIFDQLFPDVDDVFKNIPQPECSIGNDNIITALDEGIVNPEITPTRLDLYEEEQEPDIKKPKNK